MILLIAFLLVLISLLLLRLAARAQHASGLPSGQVIASDTHTWKPFLEPLYEPRLNLSGKPDYLVRQGKHIIPVEVKSTSGLNSPYQAHIFQLAAYCLLIAHTYGRRPPYGILHYPDKTFRIEFTSELEKSLNERLMDMRAKERSQPLARSHSSPARCAACGFRNICDQKLSGN